MKPIYLVDERARNLVAKQLSLEPADGTRKVTFSNAKDKSARQRGLQWIWYGDVVKSGLGGESEADKNELHLASKARWCLPIEIRDDDNFAEIYLDFHRRWHMQPEWEEKFRWFCDKVVSTEDLDQSQMAEYLTEFKNHYGYEIGVELTDPDNMGWKNLLEETR